MSTTTSPVKTPTYIQKAIDIAFPYIKLARINGLLGCVSVSYDMVLSWINSQANLSLPCSVWLTFWPCVCP